MSDPRDLIREARAAQERPYVGTAGKLAKLTARLADALERTLNELGAAVARESKLREALTRVREHEWSNYGKSRSWEICDAALASPDASGEPEPPTYPGQFGTSGFSTSDEAADAAHFSSEVALASPAEPATESRTMAEVLRKRGMFEDSEPATEEKP